MLRCSQTSGVVSHLGCSGAMCIVRLMFFNSDVFSCHRTRSWSFFGKTFESESSAWYERGIRINKGVVISSSEYKDAGQAVPASVPRSLTSGL